MTRVPVVMDAGVKVAVGHDCVMDARFLLGSADMLDVSRMGLDVAQKTRVEQMTTCFFAITEIPAATL